MGSKEKEPTGEATSFSLSLSLSKECRAEVRG